MAYRSPTLLLLLGATLLHTPAHAFEGPKADWVVRADAAVGGGNASRSRGFGPSFGLSAGRAITEGLVIDARARLTTLNAFDLDLFCEDDDAACDPPEERTGATLTFLGAGAQLYGRSGFFADVGLGWLHSTVHYQGIPSDSDVNTVGVQIGIGMEWWGNDAWGIGLKSDVTFAGGDPEDLFVNFGGTVTWD